MVSVVRIARTGGPEVMTLEETDEQSPGPAEAWVEQEAIGVNFLDVMQRNGAAPIPLPSGLGYEGAGKSEARRSRNAVADRERRRSSGRRPEPAPHPVSRHGGHRCKND